MQVAIVTIEWQGVGLVILTQPWTFDNYINQQRHHKWNTMNFKLWGM